LTSFQDQVDAEVKVLLGLKAKYKELTGEDLAPAGKGKKDKKKEAKPQEKKPKEQKKPEQSTKPTAAAADDGGAGKKITRYDKEEKRLSTPSAFTISVK